MQIKTYFDPPPIPVRSFDWRAIDDATYDGEGCPIGWGATEAEAIANLQEQIEESAGTDSMGRFNHHPDPAIDFCIEVEVIEGMAYDYSVGLAERGPLADRIFTAMQFRVGGDPCAVEAKATLRQIEQRISTDV